MPLDEHGPAPLAGSADADSVDSVDSLLREAVDIWEPSSAALPSFRLMPGDVLSDRFVVERLASSGGMGAIYRGTDIQTKEAVAIKVMASSGSGDAKRFAQEAVVLADLSHPSIVRYIAHGTTPQGTLFLAMEWLEGEDLSERLARSPLTAEESLSLMRRACEGVAVAHAQGIVHRDIKPSNLFLVNRDPGSLKVLDFGVARQREGTRTVTQSGTLLGTVGYMSPEQAMGPRDVDTRADVFALGCVLFECLTGRAAFVGQNAVAVLAKVLHAAPPRMSELRPGLGDELDTLVASMLAKNPDERPKDAAAILLALARCAGGQLPPADPEVLAEARTSESPVARTRVDTSASSPILVERRIKAKSAWLAAAAVALVIAFIGIIAGRRDAAPASGAALKARIGEATAVRANPLPAPESSRSIAALAPASAAPVAAPPPSSMAAHTPATAPGASPRRARSLVPVAPATPHLPPSATSGAPQDPAPPPRPKARTGGLIQELPF